MNATARLHDRFPALREALGYLSLGDGPTPVRRLEHLDGEVWLKDDGRYGNGGWGGNKVRKLEWLLPEARRRGKRTILTVGGLGTNWGLATALYGREHGVHTALALLDQPVDEHVTAQLDRLRSSGATLHFTHTKARTIAAVPWLLLRHRLPYLLPPGGSSPIGAIGYVEAALELAGQVENGELPEPATVVTAVGSGGTAAGLALGLRLAGLPTRVTGIVVNDALRLDAKTIARLANRCAALLRDRGADIPLRIDPAELTMRTEWLGPGYGHITPAAVHAQRLAADAEQLTLETVYTAKAFAALPTLSHDGPVLFLNTYGPRE